MEILRKTTLFKLEQQTKDLPVEDVTELAFSSLPLPPAVHLLPFRFLQRFTLVSLRPTLTALLEIPLAQFPLLRVLDVSDNKIASIFLLTTATTTSAAASVVSTTSSVAAPSLVRLFLTNNAITSMSFLEQLAVQCPALEILDLTDNPISKEGRLVRPDVFQLWQRQAATNTTSTDDTITTTTTTTAITTTSLVALDGQDENGNEVEILDSDEDSDDESDDEEGDSEEEDEEDSDDESGDDADEPPKKMPRTESN